MKEKILDFNDFGNIKQFNYLIDILKDGNFKLDDLKISCSNFSYGFAVSFQGLVKILQWLEIISIDNDKISLNMPYERIYQDDKYIKADIVYKLFHKLANKKILHNFLNSDNLIYYDEDNRIIINNNLIDFKYSNLRNFLINFKILYKDDILINSYNVNSQYVKMFIDGIIPLLESNNRRKISLEKMKKNNKDNEEAGRKAETFVLKFEQERLKGHKRFTFVKQISDDDVSAGYDIQSFNDNKSLLLDRFIEVKSYSGFPSFYLTRNEFDQLCKLGENYFIYLVDRDKMSNINYEPLIVKNPYREIIENEKWVKRVEKYYVSLQ
ncbi:MAG: DUF3883 domain-containing protein [Vallitaleaceae bacterium]|nr:DUF3883 domain-containing protein [Vallitaleaceae bacterium]